MTDKDLLDVLEISRDFVELYLEAYEDQDGFPKRNRSMALYSRLDEAILELERRTEAVPKDAA